MSEALKIALMGPRQDLMPQLMSPQQQQYNRRAAASQFKDATGTAPVRHWTQAAAQVLGGLGSSMRETYAAEDDQARAKAQKEALMQALNGGDLSASAQMLMGNPGTADMGAQLATTAISQRQAAANRAASEQAKLEAEQRKFEQDKSLIRLRADLRPQGQGPETVQDRYNNAVKFGLDPHSAEGRSYVLTGKIPTSGRGGPLSPRVEKEIFESDDMIQSGINSVDALEKAKQLNSKAYSGFGVIGANDTIGSVSSFFGDEAGQATQQLDNIVKGNALESLKATFGGMPTEGERKILIEIQGSVNQSAPVRADIYTRAQNLAKKRLAFNRWKAKALRDGTYFTSQPPEFKEYLKDEAGGSGTDLKSKYGLE